MSETIPITVADDVLEQIRAKARASGIPEEDLIRRAIEAYFSASSFRALRERIVPQARRAGFFTDEDVFREIS